MTTSTALDSDEWVHLALYSINQNEPEKAITHLKRALAHNNKHAEAWYLLGSIHADLGLYERASEELERSIKLDPDITPSAGFQLGLLYISLGEVEKAEQAWQFLDELGEDHYLFLYKRAMLHLVKDEFEDALKDLKASIALNKVNENLNEDMRDLIQRIENTMAQQNNSAKEPLNQTETKIDKPKNKTKKNALLSAYQQEDTKE